MLNRILKLEDIQDDSLFLWGARQTGKSTLLKALFPNAVYYDLLKADVFAKLRINPSVLRYQVESLPRQTIVIIDEVQKLPALLDEVHWLIVNHDTRFILCGSSARKLRRSGANLLGGRALSDRLYPLVSAEIPDFDLNRAINNGMIPRHYLVDNAKRRLASYVGDYLQQEIIAEAITRDLATFTRFMTVAAINDGEVVNYTRIAADCGVSATTVKEYFAIPEETMIGYTIPAYTGTLRRRVVQAPKFYYYDVGIVNQLLNRHKLAPGTAEYGHAFEHLIIQELVAFLDYRTIDKKLHYWRTYDNNYEVDVIIGNGEYAIELKSSNEIKPVHLRGLKAFAKEHPDAKLMVVSNESAPQIVDGIEILPVNLFLSRLWQGTIIN
jgi:predicted AAA+ superfamily ATPase